MGLGLGFVRETGVIKKTLFSTREKAGSDPWLIRVDCTSPDIVIEPKMVGEKAEPLRVVERTYELSVSLKQLPEEPGTFTSEALVMGRDASEPIWRFPISYTRRAQVFAVPSSLFATILPGEPPLDLTLAVQADDPEFQLDSRVIESPPGVTVRAGRASGSRVEFVVIPDAAGQSPIEGKIRLATNHPDLPEVAVPIHVRYENIPSH
jgi:hypothetical protein